ncbi:hypothetical protein BHE74_00012321 [Ensete ventricosum]|nr:hypothetical protein BHE74_00012321 [Ensete ventricosum]
MEGISAEDLPTIGGIATVSLLHSFIPTHWLPFSVVGRAQKWTLPRTLLVSEWLTSDRFIFSYVLPILKAGDIVYKFLSWTCSTITVMTSLVALSFYGASQLKFNWVERNDKLLVGSVLVLVGILTLIFHDHDGDQNSTEHLHRKLIV